MKRYILIALAVAAVFASCKEQHGTIFDNSVTGVYFSPIKDSYEQSRNFSDYYTADSERDSTQLVIKLTVNTLGHVDATRDRVAILRTKPLLNEETDEYYQEADLTFDERVIIPAGAINVTVPIILNCPEMHTETGSILYFDTTDPMSDFGAGIEGRCEFAIRSAFKYSEPSDWKSVKQYYGEYSQDKHIFLLSILGPGFYSKDNSQKTHYLNNHNAVEAARRAAEYSYAGRPQYVADIPFVLRDISGKNQSYERSYGRPWYWNTLRDKDRNPIDATKYFGNWFPDKDEDWSDRNFEMFAIYADLNTANEREFFANYEHAHKMVIKCMITKYNEYFRNTNEFTICPTYDEQLEYYRVNGNFRCAGTIASMDYSDVQYEVQPDMWKGDAGELVKVYYGEYSWKKLNFIINNLQPEFPEIVYFPRIFCVSTCYKSFMGPVVMDLDYTKWPVERRDNDSDDKGKYEDGYTGEDIPFHSEQAKLEQYSIFLRDKAKAAGFDWPEELPEIESEIEQE